MITDRHANLVDFCYSRLCCTSWLYCFQNPWFSSRPNEAGWAVAQLLMLQTVAVYIWFYRFTIFGQGNIIYSSYHKYWTFLVSSQYLRLQIDLHCRNWCMYVCMYVCIFSFNSLLFTKYESLKIFTIIDNHQS